jgi:cephalosporin hydroxylase
MSIFRFIWKHYMKVRKMIFPRVFIRQRTERKVADQFHKLYYGSQDIYNNTYWLGAHVFKCPFDLWVYQEIIYEVKPDLIIECGTALGGSAYFMASMCDLINQGTVVTVDILDRKGRPKHDRIKYLLGSSTSQEIADEIRGMAKEKKCVMVILDSDHAKKHVLEELNIYGKLVTKGSYLIVEDTNINGHPVSFDFGPGPMEAVDEFVKTSKDYIIDHKKEKFYLTYNPNGYLKKIR